MGTLSVRSQPHQVKVAIPTSAAHTAGSPGFQECFQVSQTLQVLGMFFRFPGNSGSIDRYRQELSIRNKENKGHRNPSPKNKENIGHRILPTTKGHRNPSIRNKKNNLKFFIQVSQQHHRPTSATHTTGSPGFRNFFRFSGSPGFRNLFQVLRNFRLDG